MLLTVYTRMMPETL